MKKNYIYMISKGMAVILAAEFLTGCVQMEMPQKEETAKELDEETELLNVSGDLPIEDNFSLYENWSYDEVTTMYLTVRSGNEADGTNHTWEEVNTYSAYDYEGMGVDKYKTEGLLQVGDENGPVSGELGYGQYVPNAVVQIRGQTSTRYKQKNYRISLKDGKGEWEDQSTINLNKHMGDVTRFMNMLCYKQMKDIDGMMSARTKFVHLYLKDETASGDAKDQFTDYGLYTYVEQINRSYLRNHNLDRNGQLYKINFFEFYPYEDIIMLKSDADYNAEEFEKHIEIKGDDDHSKLMAMLQELNDYSIPIEKTFSKWFDEENYFSWLAFHILTGNKDTDARNFFLYSPRNINKFYFISWDNDAALREYSLQYLAWRDGMAHEEGVSNYWGNILHKRVIQSQACRAKLDKRIQELKEYLSEDKMRQEVTALAAIVEPYVYRMPDVENAMLTKQQFREVMEAIPKEIELNYQKYLQSLEKPMPFFLGEPTIENGRLNFKWDSAYDFDQETISYRFQICKDYLFTDILSETENLLVPETTVDMLPPGQYFYKVTANNTSGLEQMAFDYYNSDRGKEYGMSCFWITEEGEVLMETYEE